MGLAYSLPTGSQRLHSPALSVTTSEEHPLCPCAPCALSEGKCFPYLLFGLGAAKQKEAAAADPDLSVVRSRLEIRTHDVWGGGGGGGFLHQELEVYTGSRLLWESQSSPSPWQAGRLRPEPALSFLSIWQHQFPVLKQGAGQA